MILDAVHAVTLICLSHPAAMDNPILQHIPPHALLSNLIGRC